jgi:uncharacterized protein (TIGR03437 family)
VGLRSLTSVSLFFFFSSLVLCTANLNAAPALRLSTAAVGPVSIAVGANGSAPAVEAYNAGDGTLALSVAGSVSWLAASIGPARPCTMRDGTCLPVQIALQTAGLARGTYTGVVTVRAPNAVDAPQDITVTVQMGGGVPDRVDLFVPPDGSSSEAIMNTNTFLTADISTQDGGPWLRFSLTGTGSFRFAFPYAIRATHQEGMPEGTYNGTVVTSGSPFAPDNKSIAVAMHVTSQPIARVAPDSLHVRLAQGAPKATQNLAVTNSGQGSLAISGASGSAGWLGASTSATSVAVTLDVSSLAPGSYSGSVTINSNGANGPLTVPVDLLVVSPAAPLATFQGVVDTFTLEPGVAVAAGGLASIFGEQFTTGDPAQGPDAPWSTQLGGARVLVNGLPAPLAYVSYGRIDFQVPYETTAGIASVGVERDGQAGNLVSVDVEPVVPRLKRLGIGDYGFIVNADGTHPLPAGAGTADHPAHAGDTLVLYAIGLGPTAPAVASGAPGPSDVPASVNVVPTVTFGVGLFSSGSTVDPQSATLAPGLVGLYQITVVVPDDALPGPAVAVNLNLPGTFSNIVRMAIE